MKTLRLEIHSGDHLNLISGIRIDLSDDTDFDTAKARTLGYFVQELTRYGLEEALVGIGIKKDVPHVVINGALWVSTE
jgi:hypothetical protein